LGEGFGLMMVACSEVCGARKCTLEVHEDLHVGGGGDAAWRTLLVHGG